MYRLILFVFPILTILISCNKPVSKKELKKTKENSVGKNHLDSLLNISNSKDSFEFFGGTTRFYSGNLLSDSTKHAFALYEKNSKSVLDIYMLTKNAYKLIYSLDSLTFFWVSAAIDAKDVNFDGIKDLIITRAVSNGYASTSSYIYLFDGKRGFKKVLEADTMLNFSIEGNYVTSDKLITCIRQGKSVAKNYYKWVKDRLVYIKTVSPCKNYELW